MKQSYAEIERHTATIRSVPSCIERPAAVWAPIRPQQLGNPAKRDAFLRVQFGKWVEIIMIITIVSWDINLCN